MVDLFCSKSTEIEKIFEYKIREKTGEANDWFEKRVVGPKITDKGMIAEFYSYSIVLKDYSSDDCHEMNYGHIATEEELL